MAFSNPSNFPNFPTDIEPLENETLSLSKLIANDEGETNRLYSVCTSTGLFLLDLSDHSEGQELIFTADKIFHLSEDIFEMDLKMKKQYHMLGGTVLG